MILKYIQLSLVNVSGARAGKSALRYTHAVTVEISLLICYLHNCLMSLDISIRGKSSTPRRRVALGRLNPALLTTIPLIRTLSTVFYGVASFRQVDSPWSVAMCEVSAPARKLARRGSQTYQQQVSML